MFSGVRKGYQIIDDEYDDSNITSYNNLMPSMSNGMSLFNANPSESQRLVENGRLYHTNTMAEETATPPNMNSSASIRENSHRWNHIGELDEFFTNCYEYQQEGGFSCICTKKIGAILFYGFLVAFAVFSTQCIDYDILFANKNVTLDQRVLSGKKYIGDVIVPNCAANLNTFVIISLVIAVIFCCTKIVRTVYYLMQMKDIQEFFAHALGIPDEKLSNTTWYDAMKRLCEVQSKLHLSINNENLKPIDIYHRILRFENIFIAMVNQRIMPPVFEVPIVGKVAYLPNGLKYNIKRCLFKGSSSPWNGPKLKDDFRDTNPSTFNRVTRELEQQVFWFAIVNFVLMPFIFIYQLLNCLAWIAEWIKKNPAEIGARRYSNYGKYRVRHFQELDHELTTRLNRSHRYANHYMNQFFSPLMKVLASYIRMMAAIILIYLVTLTAWDEDTVQVEHVVTIMAGLGIVFAICTSLIPDETLVFQPEALLTRVTSELQYLPSEWKGKAHHDDVRREFEEIFQAKWMFLLHEITSPIITPFILYFWMRPKCRDVITFFREYTTTITGTGDVCSFAILDVAVHGDPQWNGNASTTRTTRPAFDGKTEMSALNFARLIPDWKPPVATDQFLNQFKIKLDSDAAELVRGTPNSLNRNRLLESVHSLLLNKPGPARQPTFRNENFTHTFNRIITPLEEVEPLPAVPKANSLIDSLRQSGINLDDDAGADVRVQTLYLREMHDEFRQSVAPSNYGTSVAPHTMASIFDVPVASNYGSNDDSIIINTAEPGRLIRPAPSHRYDEREEDARAEGRHTDDNDERPNSSFKV